MKTYSAKPTDIKRQWYQIDASSASLGRISTTAASLLIGKGKPQFTKHIDCGDFVVITNAAKLVVTGHKLLDKTYHRHSGYPGGLKSLSLSQQLAKDPRRVVYLAVRGMLPANKLRTGRLIRLKIYNDQNHTHQSQKPLVIQIGANGGQ